jgi:hypothetical protein
VVVQLAILKSYEKMGKAKVECTSGCTCKSTTFDGTHSEKNTQLFLHSFGVRTLLCSGPILCSCGAVLWPTTLLSMRCCALAQYSAEHAVLLSMHCCTLAQYSLLCSACGVVLCLSTLLSMQCCTLDIPGGFQGCHLIPGGCHLPCSWSSPVPEYHTIASHKS